MPSKRKVKTEPLPSDIQRQIDAVRTGHSTTLSLVTYESDRLIEIPDDIRDLSGLRSLSLGASAVSIFPSWLDELPDLETIDIAYASIASTISFLPNVRWSVNA